jgi:hypothetical protein
MYPPFPNGGITWDLIEMGCIDSNNYYLSTYKNRIAQTISCNRQGLGFFHTNSSNHNKIFVDPKNTKFVESPHWVIWTIFGEYDKFGSYRHFNNMKYSKQFNTLIGNGFEGDRSIEYFTYDVLKNYVGVYPLNT